MEIIVNAIVLKTVDYKDNDKILTLYSLEKGIITAGIKGVKKSGAKLKFASEPFAFCEYVLAQKGDKYNQIIRDDIEKEIKNNLIRALNCESANQDKVISTALTQIQAKWVNQKVNF